MIILSWPKNGRSMVLKLSSNDFFKRVGYYDRYTGIFTSTDKIELSSDELKQLSDRISRISSNLD